MAGVIRLRGVEFDRVAIAQRLVGEGWNVLESDDTHIVAQVGKKYRVDPIARASTPLRLNIVKVDDAVFLMVSLSALQNSRAASVAAWTKVVSVFPEASADWLTGSEVPRRLRQLTLRRSLEVNLLVIPVLILVAFVMAQATKAFIMAPLVINHDVMAPTLPNGSRVLLYRGPFMDRLVERGTIVMRRSEGGTYIGRVVAAGPSTVLVENGRVIIDSQLQEEPYASGTDGTGSEYELEADQMLIMNDDRTDPGLSTVDSEDVDGVIFASYSLRGFKRLTPEE